MLAPRANLGLTVGRRYWTLRELFERDRDTAQTANAGNHEEGPPEYGDEKADDENQAERCPCKTADEPGNVGNGHMASCYSLG